MLNAGNLKTRPPRVEDAELLAKIHVVSWKVA